MITRGLLDQLLKSGQDLLQQKSAGGSAGGSGGLAGQFGRVARRCRQRWPGRRSGHLAQRCRGWRAGGWVRLGLAAGQQKRAQDGRQGADLRRPGGARWRGRLQGLWQLAGAAGRCAAGGAANAGSLCPRQQAELHSQAVLKALGRLRRKPMGMSTPASGNCSRASCSS